MDYETMRLKCLELATQQGLKGDEAIRAAERMMKFCKEGGILQKAYGDVDKSIAEIEANIRRPADKIETPKATIYREPPLSDYKPE